jgi:hypothetical protein
VVRHIKFGEGDYDTTEKLIRELLAEKPGVTLPAPVDSVDTTPKDETTPETYLSVGKAGNYGGSGQYDQGTFDFTYPAKLASDTFALRGRWSLDYQGATSDSDESGIALDYHAKDVYIVAGGEGSLKVTRGDSTTSIPISGPPTLHQIVDDDSVQRGKLEVSVPRGLQVFSFTYG